MNETHVLNWDSPIERYFEQISAIPRGSGNEKAISDFVVNFARERKLEVQRDELYNVIVKKPASADAAGKEPVILEAHMDMVCARLAESDHDFEKDPVKLILEDGMLTADGTTLGADDGFGVAYMLAVLDDDSLSHPPLECVFTVREEIDMGGVAGLDMSRLAGKRMIGLDGDHEKAMFVACSCSDRIIFEQNYAVENAGGAVCEIILDEFFTGTYQGVTHPECGNVIKMVARLLRALGDEEIPYRIAVWQAGTAENVNPYKGKTVIVTAEQDQERAEAVLQREFADIMAEIGDDRFAGRLVTAWSGGCRQALKPQDSARVTVALNLTPNNSFQVSLETGEVTAINNIGLMNLEDGAVKIVMSARAKRSSSEKALVSVCREAGLAAGFSVRVEDRYKPWDYDPDSKMRALAKSIAKKLYGYDMKEEICPGGLELAHFFSAKKDLDGIQLGAELKNLHTPEETMDMASFHRVYRLLCEMLASID